MAGKTPENQFFNKSSHGHSKTGKDKEKDKDKEKEKDSIKCQEEKRKQVKSLIDKIPTQKEDLFAFKLDCSQVTKHLQIDFIFNEFTL